MACNLNIPIIYVYFFGMQFGYKYATLYVRNSIFIKLFLISFSYNRAGMIFKISKCLFIYFFVAVDIFLRQNLDE